MVVKYMLLSTLYHYSLYSGFIAGEEGEYPAIIAFKPNYVGGALLVVVRCVHVLLGYREICMYWRVQGVLHG